MNWLHFAYASTVLFAVLLLLGAPIAYALRARAFSFITVTFAAGLAVLAATQLLASVLPIKWGLLYPVAVTAVVAVVLLIFRKPLSKTEAAASYFAKNFKQRRKYTLKPLLAAAIAGSIALLFMLSALRSPAALSQTFDANFHLNLADRFAATGVVSMFDVNLASPARPTFYPSLWHAIVALVIQLTGVSTPIATNVVALICIAVIWPIGVQAFSRALFGPSTAVTLAALIAAVALPNLPYSPAVYGVLYPTLLSLVLLPYVFVAAVRIFNVTDTVPLKEISLPANVILFIGALSTAVLAQPSSLYPALLFLLPLFLLTIYRAGQQQKTKAGIALIFATTGFAMITGLAWIAGKTGFTFWPLRQNVFTAIFDAFGGAPRFDSNAWLLGGVMLLGTGALLIMQKRRWLLLCFVLYAALYVVAETLNHEWLRNLITGPWYNDSWRLAMLVGLGALPVFVYGLSSLLVWIRLGVRAFAKFSDKKFKQLPLVVATPLLIFVFITNPGMQDLYGMSRDNYDADEIAQLVSKDELAAFDYLETKVNGAETVINNPWNGGAMVEALTSARALFPHTGGNYPTYYYGLVNGISSADPAACATAAEMNVKYLLDFGSRVLMPEERLTKPFSPLNNIDQSTHPALTLVFEQGDAKVYEITGCN